MYLFSKNIFNNINKSLTSTRTTQSKNNCSTSITSSIPTASSFFSTSTTESAAPSCACNWSCYTEDSEAELSSLKWIWCDLLLLHCSELLAFVFTWHSAPMVLFENSLILYRERPSILYPFPRKLSTKVYTRKPCQISKCHTRWIIQYLWDYSNVCLFALQCFFTASSCCANSKQIS